MVIVIIIVIIIYYWWQARNNNTVVIKDDSGNVITPTAAQQQQATALADRIHNDLNSGVLGFNMFGIIGRDLDAYDQLAQASDTDFALTAQTYKSKYGSSLIADIRAESSIAGGTAVNLIEAKATRLNMG